MFRRRTMIATGILAPFLLPRVLCAQTEEDLIATGIRDWINQNKDEGYFDPPEIPGDQKGTLILAPNDERVREAANFLAKVPQNLTPLETAKWMIDHRDQGEAVEWPPDSATKRMPANPIIIAFFAATKTKPTQGDETAWCAAFVNWILLHCGVKRTNSAASASFRSYEQPTSDPRLGDIVCFENTSDSNFGHVGFFNGWVNGDQKAISVCGGNQKNQLGINVFPVSGSRLKLHSFRTTQGLRA